MSALRHPRQGDATDAAAAPAPGAWWRRAVLYEIYIRSFADADGDGVGDIAGIRSRLPYLRDLGVDAVWITPWYPSPMADGGYDVADYRDIDPLFGSLEDARGLVIEAHRLGLRLLVDLVPNHTSSQHPWFRAAVAAGRGSPERARYLFRDGRGARGDEAPNDWVSAFGGPAWTRVEEADGTPGQWYLHLFAPGQPDLDWSHPEVRAEFESILGFWLELGVDGFRIDVADSLAKDPALVDLAAFTPPDPGGGSDADRHPHWDREAVHEIYRGWRRVVEAHGGRAVLVGEIGSPPGRLARYLRPDELHGAFNFEFMRRPWDAGELRTSIDLALESLAAVGAAPTWVLSNHDVTRHATRLGRPFTGLPVGADWVSHQPSDRELGLRRARAAALLLLALPGAACLYQGEELGLPEVEDLPESTLADPIWERSGHADRGRDGCRVPIPWSGDAPPYGFGPPGSLPWLPQPVKWGSLAAAAQEADPASMLRLYRAALRVRRGHPGLAGEAFRWLPSPDGVLLFERAEGLRCALNLSGGTYRLPVLRRLLVASCAIEGDLLPVDGAAWFEVPGKAG